MAVDELIGALVFFERWAATRLLLSSRIDGGKPDAGLRVDGAENIRPSLRVNRILFRDCQSIVKTWSIS